MWRVLVFSGVAAGCIYFAATYLLPEDNDETVKPSSCEEDNDETVEPSSCEEDSRIGKDGEIDNASSKESRIIELESLARLSPEKELVRRHNLWLNDELTTKVYSLLVHNEWAEAKKELQIERDNVRKLTLEHESAMRGSMQRIEEVGKELANALRAVSEANARASAAEERLSHYEKMKNSELDKNASTSNTDDMAQLKEEIEKLRVEAQSCKDHMLQYRSFANVNEAALKQMEDSHENFKAEAEKVKKSLEDEVASLKEHVNQLQDGYNLQAKEAASAAESQSLLESSKLREECTEKLLCIEGLETQMSAMKNNLETAQENYERRVIIQSETIQELTKTSQELAKVQEKASELERISDILKIENSELKSKWETEKLALEEAKERSEKNYNEINEQNKLFHDQLEALHIKMAEKESRINNLLQTETSLKLEMDKHKRFTAKFKRRSDNLSKEKEELSKKNLELSKELADSSKIKRSNVENTSPPYCVDQFTNNQAYIIGQGLDDFLPYITQVQNVTMDGNCGFRAIAVCVGHHEDNWRQIRRDLLHELDVHNATYTSMFNKEVQSLRHILNHFKEGYAPPEHWMDTSVMGSLIASCYSVVVIVLSNDKDRTTTYLPLFTSPPTAQNIWVIGHVNGNHYVRLVLQGDFPMPPTDLQWSFHAVDHTWVIPYLDRQK